MITSHPIETHNNTKLTIAELKELTKQDPIWWYRSNWRQRIVTLYPHPTDPERCISVGITFDEEMQVIADEELSQHWAFKNKQRIME